MLSVAKHLLFPRPQKQILRRCAPQNDTCRLRAVMPGSHSDTCEQDH